MAGATTKKPKVSSLSRGFEDMNEPSLSGQMAPKRLFFAVFLLLFLSFGGKSLRAQDAAPVETAPPQIPASTMEPAPTLPAPSLTTPLETAPDYNALPPTGEGAGAEAWYYEARKLEQSADADPKVSASIDLMYALAFHFGEKAAAREAGKALLQRSIKAADPAFANIIAYQWLDYFGPDWDIYKALLSNFMDTGDFDGALKTIATLRAALPSTAKTKANELAYYEYASKASLGDYSWLKNSLSFLKAYSLDSWGAKILRLAVTAPDLDAETKEVCLMRAGYQEKKYDEAALHALGASNYLHGAGVGRFLISEAGKSFINAAAFDQGIAFFMDYFPEAMAPGAADFPEAVVSSLKARNSEERLWVAAYYLARAWLSAERGREAAILFLALTDNAPSAADADGALWYWLDITMKRIAAEDIASFDEANVAAMDTPAAAAPAPSPTNDTVRPGARRSLEFAALVEASRRWKNPSYFDDIVESYDRNLLKGKAWDDVLSLLILIGDRVSPGIKTRLLYQGGRLIEERLALRRTEETQESDLAGEYFKAIVDNPEAEEYYRTMASWRLGLAPPYLKAFPELSSQAAAAEGDGHASPNLDQAYAAYTAAIAATGTGPAGSNGNGLQSALTLIRNYLNYDLDEMASAVAMNYLGTLDKSLIAGLAFELSTEGQHYAALRLARDAVNRGAGAQYPELYGLVYPKAWNGIIAAGAAIPGIPEALAYGIIRSESVFDPKAVSYAGAVGLTQLMPSTAAETARGLKMPGYSLIDPSDNVRIGLTYYSYMLSRFGGKPMRAMFAYNAGPSRMMAWAKESGELPDDILLETLHLAQPRQYAKNIIQASLAYGKIHYGIDPDKLLDYLVLGKPLEAATPPPPANPAPAVIPATAALPEPAIVPAPVEGTLDEEASADMASPANGHGPSM